MPITETAVRSLATAQSYERGEDYYYTHAVSEVQKRGNTLVADVEGSSYEPYHVTIELSEDEIMSTSCTCPYDWGGICKHIVAVLLTYLRQPKQIDERPSVHNLLANVGETDLRELLIDLLTTEPHLIERVEAKLEILAATSQEKSPTTKKQADAAKPSPQRSASINAASFRRQAQQIMRSAGYRDSYDVGWDIAHQISTLFNQAQPFLDAGDGRNALLILEAVMEPFIDCWYDYDYEGEVGEVFVNVGPLFTEAILSADLSKDERKQWRKKLEEWQAEISDYGIDDAFDAAVVAAEQGWEYPPLQKVLQGHIINKGAWEGDAPFYADDLAIARLNVLERQGRTQEYLYLAEAEGQTALYLTMLVNLDRGKEAVEYALQYAATADEALALAQALNAHNQPDEAIKIAEYGLTLHGETLALARWLRDMAKSLSKSEIALKAARTAFARSYAMEDYSAVEAIAGAEWSSVKSELLTQLASAEYAYSRIDIYLHEGMVAEAIKTIDRKGYADYDTVGKVVDVAWQSHPDWVIQQCKKQAEPIMNGGKSKYYHHAVRWLEKAGRAYLAANREKEWQAYLEALITKHVRKSSLRPQLEALHKLSVKNSSD